MRKAFCDACGNEIIGQRYSFSFLIHITDEVGSGYVTNLNGKWLSTSGREESKDLCLECYNKIYSIAWNEFKCIQQKQN